MTDNRNPLRRVCLSAALVCFASPGMTQQWNPLSSVPKPNASARKPAITIKCLPPGAKTAVPCSAAAAGATVQIDANIAGPLKIVVMPAGARDKSIVGPRAISPKPLPSREGSYVLTMPRHWCAGQAGDQKIQIMTVDLNQSEPTSAGDADSIGYFQMRC